MRAIDLLIQISELFAYKVLKDRVGNEYVFLDSCECPEIDEVADKTALESQENHVHLYDHISPTQLPKLISAGRCLGNAVLSTLTMKFPRKRFMVYVTLKQEDAMTLRFHQVWPDEEPFCYPTDFEDTDELVILFQN